MKDLRNLQSHLLSNPDLAHKLGQLTDDQLLLLFQGLQRQSSTESGSRPSSIQPITSIELPKTKEHPPQVININIQMPDVSQIANPVMHANANPTIETKALASSDAANSSSAKDENPGNIGGFLVCVLVASLALVIVNVGCRK